MTTGEFRVPSAAIWINSGYIERWLGTLWPGWRVEDVRHGWDEEKRWYWVVPDYDRGRSRIVGMPMKLLETTTASMLREVLERHRWRERVDREPLFVDRRDDGAWLVEAWAPKVSEAWFPSPDGGYFVAFWSQGHGVSVGPYPADNPVPFLALHGKAWSAMGPKEPKAPDQYTLAELYPYLDVARRAAAT